MNEVLELLKKKNIEYDIVEHEVVHTIEDMKKIGLLDKGYVLKNLFLRNASGKIHYLYSCYHDKDVDLKEFADKVGSSRLSFASADRLEKYLGLEQGYVSPLGVINDESQTVIFVFDSEIKNEKKVGVHPNTNKATIYLAFKDIEKIIKEHGNEIIFI